MMMTFDTFKQEALDAGFDEVLERQWDADIFLDTHTHPFSVRALVVKGEMWLGIDGETRQLTPGSIFEVAYEVPHSERYGSEGATYWVARKK